MCVCFLSFFLKIRLSVHQGQWSVRPTGQCKVIVSQERLITNHPLVSVCVLQSKRPRVCSLSTNTSRHGMAHPVQLRGAQRTRQQSASISGGVHSTIDADPESSPMRFTIRGITVVARSHHCHTRTTTISRSLSSGHVDVLSTRRSDRGVIGGTQYDHPLRALMMLFCAYGYTDVDVI